MTDSRAELVGFWVRAPEEDEGGVFVYRPRGWDLPPARGREGLELRDDGTAIMYEIAPGDGLDERHGRWSTSDPVLELELEHGIVRRLEIIEVSDTVLKVAEG